VESISVAKNQFSRRSIQDRLKYKLGWVFYFKLVTAATRSVSTSYINLLSIRTERGVYTSRYSLECVLYRDEVDAYDLQATW